MKWFFNRAKKNKKEGLVGVFETQTSISAAYVVFENGKGLVKAQLFEAAGIGDQSAKQAALKRFVDQNQLQGVACSYVLGFGDYSLNLIEAPAVPKGEVAKAASWLLRDLISFPIEQAAVDTFEIPLLRARDNISMIYAVVTRKTLVSKIESFIKASMLDLNFIDIPEIALKNIIILDDIRSKSCAFVQLHSKGGHLILCQDKKICIIRSIELNLEDLSNQEGPSTLESLSLEIQRSFDYINSVFRQNIDNVVVLAPTLQDKTLIQASIKSAFGAEVYVMNLKDLLLFNSPATEEEEAECLLAIGSALRREEVVIDATNQLISS